MLVKLYRYDGSVFEVPGNQVNEFLAMGLTENPPAPKPKSVAEKEEDSVKASLSSDDSDEGSAKKRSYTKK